VKNIKFAVLAFGVLGLLGLLVTGGIMEGIKHDTANTVLVLAGFAIPAVLGGLAIKAGLKRPQAGIALAGFALTFVKLRVWQMIKFLSLMPMGLKLAIIASAAGLVVAIVAVAKPEE